MENDFLVPKCVWQVGVLAALSWCGTADAFDCKLAKTPTEKTICNNHDLLTKDAQLNVNYKALRDHWTKKSDTCNAAYEAMRQKEWLQARDKCGTDVKCISDAYDQRLGQIRAHANMCLMIPNDVKARLGSACATNPPVTAPIVSSPAAPPPVTAPVVSSLTAPTTSNPSAVENCSDDISKVDDDMLKEAYPKIDSAHRDDVKDVLNQVLSDKKNREQLNTREKMAHFLSQTSAETGGSLIATEGLNYNAYGLKQTYRSRVSSEDALRYGRIDSKVKVKFKADLAKPSWPGKEPPTKSDCKGVKWKECTITWSLGLQSNADVDNLGNQNANEVEIANTVYGGRAALGNNSERGENGDGYRYRGRGAIQLTGKNNYRDVAEKTNEIFFPGKPGVDFLNNPDSVNESAKNATYAAVSFWVIHNIGVRIESGSYSVKQVTKIVNGGYNGLAERESIYKNLRKINSLMPCK